MLDFFTAPPLPETPPRTKWRPFFLYRRISTAGTAGEILENFLIPAGFVFRLEKIFCRYDRDAGPPIVGDDPAIQIRQLGPVLERHRGPVPLNVFSSPAADPPLTEAKELLCYAPPLSVIQIEITNYTAALPIFLDLLLKGKAFNFE